MAGERILESVNALAGIPDPAEYRAAVDVLRDAEARKLHARLRQHEPEWFELEEYEREMNREAEGGMRVIAYTVVLAIVVFTATFVTCFKYALERGW